MAHILCSVLALSVLGAGLLTLATLGHSPNRHSSPGDGGFRGDQRSTEKVAVTNLGFVLGP